LKSSDQDHFKGEEEHEPPLCSLTQPHENRPIGQRSKVKGVRGEMFSHLHSQAHGVAHDQEEHEVLEVAGGDDVPHLVLVRVLGDVASQGAGLQGVLHTLALDWWRRSLHNVSTRGIQMMDV